MKKNLLFGAFMLAAGSLLAADSNPKDDVTAAANALDGQANYSWTTTTENGGGGGGFNRGPTNGKLEKDGYTSLSMSFNDNTMEALFKGTNGAIKTPDNGWQSLAEATQGDGGGGFNPGTMIARTISTFKAPSAEALQLAGDTKSLTAGANGITGDLTEDAAKTMLTFRRGRPGGGGGGGGAGPTIANPKGTVTFWVADGKLSKYQVHVTGTVSFGGNDRDIDRTTTTEIKDVGTTKVTVDDDAKKKLQ